VYKYALNIATIRKGLVIFLYILRYECRMYILYLHTYILWPLVHVLSFTGTFVDVLFKNTLIFCHHAYVDRKLC
jgi:hypothetical protein